MPALHFTNINDVERAERMITNALIQVLNLQGMDAEALRQPGTEFTVLTRAGTLHGKIMRGTTIRRGLHLPPWVHFRFEDVANAADRFRICSGADKFNHHSGKWNHMFGVDSLEVDLHCMVSALEQLNPRNFTVKAMN